MRGLLLLGTTNSRIQKEGPSRTVRQTSSISNTKLYRFVSIQVILQADTLPIRNRIAQPILMSRAQFDQAILFVYVIKASKPLGQPFLEPLDNHRDRTFDSHPQKPNFAEQQ